MNFNIAADRRNTNSIKWSRRAIENIAANADAEPFWVADMDFLPEPHVQEAGRMIAGQGIYGYPSYPQDNKAVESWLRQKHGWIVSEEDIIFCQGLLHGLALAINLFTKEGDSILVPSPMYRPFRLIPERNGRNLIEHDLDYEDGCFSLNRERFEKDAQDADMIVFCSPQNPSGLVFSEDDLEFVLNVAKKRDIVIISDEIHSDLVHPGAKHLPMGLVNEHVGAKCITLFAPSKTFNIAGEHSAITIFSDKSMKEKFQHTTDALSLSSPGYLIGELFEEVYRNGYEYNLALCSYLKKNADLIRSYFENELPCLKLTNGDASFVTFIDCSSIYEKVKEKVLSSGEYPEAADGGVLSRFFGHDALVAMNDGTWFGKEYPMFVRFNYGTSSERVLGALERMKRAIRALD